MKSCLPKRNRFGRSALEVDHAWTPQNDSRNSEQETQFNQRLSQLPPRQRSISYRSFLHRKQVDPDAEGAHHSVEHLLINKQQNETANDCFAMMEALSECADHLDLNWTDAARERSAGNRLALQLRQHATQCRVRGQQLAGT